jgi:hypothetical protein
VSAAKIRLGNGTQVFACCGGTSFHVGSMHPEMEQEKAEEHRRVEARRAEQDRRRAALVGQSLSAIEVNPGFSATLTFANGNILRVSLVGGEMDGHFDPPGNRSLGVRVFTDEEFKAKRWWE